MRKIRKILKNVMEKQKMKYGRIKSFKDGGTQLKTKMIA